MTWRQGVWAAIWVGLIARLVRIVWFAPLTEIEGVEYARLAQNLFERGAYEGILPGPAWMFPPLHALALGAVDRLLGLEDPILAARLVSLIAGVSSIFLIAKLARRLAGPTAAVLAAWLAALHPGLILQGSATFSESLAMALALGGGVLLHRTLRSQSVGAAAASGALFGLAYLTRVEAAALAAFSGLVLLFGLRWKLPLHRKRALRCALAYGLAGILVCSPYIVYISGEAGALRFEGKGDRVGATIARFANGLDFRRASYELAEDGTPLGPWLDPNGPYEPSREARTTGQAASSTIAKYVFGNYLKAGFLLSTGQTVSSILWLMLFAWVSFRARRGPRHVRRFEWWLLGWAALAVLASCFYKVLLRYLMPIALLGCLQAARGLATLPSLQPAAPSGRRPLLLVTGLSLVLLLSLGRGAFIGFREFDEGLPGNASALEQRARLIAMVHRPEGEEPERSITMAKDPRWAWASDTIWTPLPVADSFDAVRRRAAAVGATVIVLERARDGMGLAAPASDWFPDGFPADWTVLSSTPEGVILHARAR